MLEGLFRIIERKVKQEGNVNQFYESAFQELINEGQDLFVVDTTRYFCMEIDTPDDLRIAGELMQQG
jgi:NDP-sugar pyrophosphorylase family protein